MQFHLNGFRPGDPDIRPATDGARSPSDAPPDTVDVVIVGAGPAGLTLAAYLSAFADITTCIVESKDGPMEKGQADGVSCRSMEMFQAFGFAEKVKREAYQVNETTFWKPDPARPGDVVRAGRVRDVEEGLSHMPHVILNQARVHDMFLAVMRAAPSRLAPHYSRRVIGLSVDPAAADHPVTVRIERVGPAGETAAETTVQTIRARYVVGCDGARSAVRRAIGRELRGDAANKLWGVMDVLAVTDFPDIRRKSLIGSEGEGTVLIIPREGGHLVRLYVELESLGPEERARDRAVTADRLIEVARQVMRPFALEVKDVVWWSAYEIGQRLTDRFDDAGDGRPPRVFIAGDACHTHSPKAGQGMNVSMGDAFNLGWKLALVLRGRAGPDLLRSYSSERQAVARDLIEFDEEWARVIAERGADGDGEAGDDAPKFQRYFIEHGRYTAGVSVRYAPSLITGPGRWQALAPGFAIGTRFHSAPVIRQADGKPMQLGDAIEADARWRLFAFAGAGDACASGSALSRLCGFLADDPASPLRRFTPAGADVDAAIDVRAVLQQDFRNLEITALPPLLRPAKGRFALTDYEKAFCADPGADIFDARGVDRDAGCVVVVRPDQHVAHVLPLEAHDALAAFFGGVMIAPGAGARV
jgi:phenol 2-monooxygenase